MHQDIMYGHIPGGHKSFRSILWEAWALNATDRRLGVLLSRIQLALKTSGRWPSSPGDEKSNGTVADNPTKSD